MREGPRKPVGLPPLQRARVLGACWSGSPVHGRTAKVTRTRARTCAVRWQQPPPRPLRCALLQGR